MDLFPSLRRIAFTGMIAVALVLTGCDDSSPTATQAPGDKADVEASLDKAAPAEAPGATELVGTRASEAIPGQYIVVLKDDAVQAKSQSAVRALAETMIGKSGTVKHAYATALTGFAASNLSDTRAKALADDPRVAYVEQDQTMHAVASQSNATWGLDRVDARTGLDSEYTYNTNASNVNAYIIDTGIRTSHAEFGNRASAGYDAIGDGRNGQDCNGHGTHVAGTVGGSSYGVAKGVDLIAIRVLDCQGRGSNSGVIAGVDWVANNHVKPAVANMSLGGGASSALDSAVNNAISKGVSFAVAAGNSNTDACGSSPARVSAALTVGATNSSDQRASFSNYGSCVDINAPGVNITSAWSTSDTATNTIDGTSMASPHVAGVQALYLAGNTGASPSTVNSEVIGTSTLNALSGLNGSPNKLVYSLLTTTNRDVGGGGGGGGGGSAPCSNCSVYSGSLSGSGDNAIQPNGTYYSGNGTEIGYLRGPSGADFDLYLYRWNGYGWSEVASGISSDSNEDVSYSGSSGYFYWEITSYSGSGSYDFYLE